MSSNQKTYPLDFDGLIEHVKDVCSEGAAKKVLKQLKRRKLKQEITEEYEKRKGYGKCEKIQRDLAEEYFGDRESFLQRVKNMIYKDDDLYFNY